jgi:hypothetical protein
MTVLYLIVRTTYYAIAWLTVVLTPKCSRYAILEYHIQCMFIEANRWSVC